MSVKELHTVSSLQKYRAALPSHATVGLVPTMGNLHAGHTSLVAASVAANSHTIVSIFVNPAQFGPNEDLSSYPRSLAADLAICQELAVTAVFIPSTTEAYSQDDCTVVRTTVGDPNQNPRSESAARPSMFAGVATIVTKLVIATRPHRLYMGQKDVQQLAVVRSLLRDLWLPSELVVLPIVREHDGLAMSSRNNYLSKSERACGPVLYEALTLMKKSFDNGQRNTSRLRSIVLSHVAEKVASWSGEVSFEMGYVSVCERWTMREVHGDVQDDTPTVMCVAAKLGRTRLIDNMLLTKSAP